LENRWEDFRERANYSWAAFSPWAWAPDGRFTAYSITEKADGAIELSGKDSLVRLPLAITEVDHHLLDDFYADEVEAADEAEQAGENEPADDVSETR
jgi:hypothetical protein